MEHMGSYFGLAALGSLVAACWSYVRSFWTWVGDFFIVRVHVSGLMAKAMSIYCWQKMNRSPFGERAFGGANSYVRPVRKIQAVGYEWCGRSAALFWHGWRPLWIGGGRGPNEGTVPAPDDNMGMTIRFIRGTMNLEKILVDALDLLNHQNGRTGAGEEKRFRIRRVSGTGSIVRRRTQRGMMENGRNTDAPATAVEHTLDVALGDKRLLRWQRDELGWVASHKGSPFDLLAFPSSVLVCVDEVSEWLRSRDWYESKGIPWRRGLLLYGPPGTGKTSLVRAVGQELDLPIVAFDLTGMSNDEFLEQWRDLPREAPCIALLEDFDAVFSGRENMLGENGGGLTFDCLLNCISGIEPVEGVLLVVTTNKVENIDSALGVPVDGSEMSSRPGRIDRTLELPPLDEDCRRRLAEIILAECPQHIERLVEEGFSDTGAQFQDRCRPVALAEYWKGRNGHRVHRNGVTVISRD